MYKRTGDTLLDEQYRKSLQYSILDGSFFALMMGLGEYYFSAYALALGASMFQMGFFGSVPTFLASFAQLASPRINNVFASRKKTLMVTNIIRNIIWIPIILSFLLPSNIRVWALIVLVSLYFIVNYIQAGPWTSWMGDLVDEVQRPKYFATRNRIVTSVMVVATVLGGLIIESVKSRPEYNALTGFVVVFIIAVVGSLLSTLFISLKKDVPFAEREEDKFNLWQFTSKITQTRFGKFTLFHSLFHLGVFVAAPFFIAYQMNYLHFTYIDLMIALSMTSLGKMLSFKAWAALTDRYGNAKVLLTSVIIICFLPLAWIFFVSAPWHVFILNLFGGIAWAGYDLLSFNFIFDTVSPPKRARATSYMTFYKGTAILVGGLIGSLIFKRIPEAAWVFLLLFGISSAIRFITSLYFVKNIDELKEVEPISHRKLIVELFTSIPREGMESILVGVKTAKNRFVLIADQTARFIDTTQIKARKVPKKRDFFK